MILLYILASIGALFSLVPISVFVVEGIFILRTKFKNQ